MTPSRRSGRLKEALTGGHDGRVVMKAWEVRDVDEMVELEVNDHGDGAGGTQEGTRPVAGAGWSNLGSSSQLVYSKKPTWLLNPFATLTRSPGPEGPG